MMQHLGYFWKVCVFSDNICKIYDNFDSLPTNGRFWIVGTKTPIPHNQVISSLAEGFELVPEESLVLNRASVFENFRKVFEPSFDVWEFEEVIVATQWCSQIKGMLKLIVASRTKIESIRVAACNGRVIAESVYCQALQHVVPFDQEGLNGLFAIQGKRGLELDLVVNNKHISTWKVKS